MIACDVLDAGHSVAAKGRHQAKNKETGILINSQFAHVWKLYDGKAVSFQQYSHANQHMNAVGGP